MPAPALRRFLTTLVLAAAILVTWHIVRTNSLPKVHYKVTGVGASTALISYRDGNHTVTMRNASLPFTAVVSGTQIAVIVARDNATTNGASLTCQIHVANVAPIDNTYRGSDPDVECSG